MNPKEFKLPPDFPGRVRLFPLPDLVFFPNNVQPLHIFEDRYVDMLDEALDGDRLIAMATLKPNFESEYHGRPAISSTVCIGEVAMHKRAADGTYNLALVGIARARVLEELSPSRSFREASVEVLHDSTVSDAQSTKQKGQRLASIMKRVAPTSAKLTREFISGNLSLAAYTDVLAFRLPLDLPKKLSLLQEPDATIRAAMLVDWVAPTPETKSFPTDNRSFPPDFSVN